MNMNGFQEAIAYAAYVGAMSAISALGSMNLDNQMEQIPTSPCEGDDHMARKKFTFTLPNGESAWATGNTINDAFTNAFRKYGALFSIKSSPVKNALLKNPGKPAGHHTALPPEEMVRIKKQLPTLSKERERLYLTLLVYTGMRPEEILGMRWEHIHLDLGYCRVARTVTYEGPKKATCINDSGKTLHALRTVPLPTPAVQILQKASCKEGYVISSKAGTAPVSYSTHQRDCEHVFEELGIKGDFSSYDFRTTYGTELCEAGLTSKQVGDLMGHADTRMVETVYARSREEGILTQLDFLNQLNESYVN